MSTILHPVGPETPQTYWVRRAIVIVAAVIVLSLLGWAISGLGGGADKKSAVPASSTSGATAPAQPEASPTPSSVPTGSSDPASSEETTGASSDASAASTAGSSAPSSTNSAQGAASSVLSGTDHLACDPAQVQLAITGNSSVTAGTPTQISVLFTNVSDYACVLDLGTHPFELRIYSGPDRIWSTRDCQSWLPTSPMGLASRGSVKYTVTWPTLRSASGCKLLQGRLASGTYVARAQVDGGRAKELVMSLHS